MRNPRQANRGKARLYIYVVPGVGSNCKER